MNWIADKETREALLVREHQADVQAGRGVWATYRNADTTEGRGPMILIGLFSDLEAAQASREGHGIMGGSGRQDTDFKYFAVHGSLEQYMKSLPAGDRTKQAWLGANDAEYRELVRLKAKFGE